MISITMSAIAYCYAPWSVFYKKYMGVSPDILIPKILGNHANTVPDFENAIEILLHNHKKRLKFLPSPHNIRQPLDQKFLRQSIWTLVDLAVPVEFLGSKRNRRILKKFIYKLPSKGMQEVLGVGWIISKADLQSVVWLLNVPELQMKKNIYNKAVRWLVHQYIFSAIGHAFFVCKAVKNNNVQYFWKPAWRYLSNKAFKQFRDKSKCAIVTDSVEGMWKERGGVSLQFRPKGSIGLRPVMVKSIPLNELNRSCRNMEVLMKFLVALYRNVSSNFSCAQGRDFVKVWRTKYFFWKGKQIHFVKVDVKDAFGSVKHEVLESILKMYLLKYVMPGQVVAVKKIQGKRRILFNIFDDDFNSFSGLTEYYPAELLFGTIVHVFEFFVFKWRTKFYKLNHGLAQGACLSVELCNIYLHALDREYLNEFIKKDTLLMREVDDYLFATACLEDAARFYGLMRKGIPQFNIKVNKKTETSDSHRYLCYLQYQIDTENLQVDYNYKKYITGDITHTLLMGCGAKKEKFIKMKIMQTCCLDDILVDGFFNQKSTIIQILFRRCYLQASRLHGMVVHLLERPLHPGLIMQCVFICATFIEKKAITYFHQNHVGKYIGVRAFFEKLRKHDIYGEFLHDIHCYMKSILKTFDSFQEIELVITHLLQKTNGDPLITPI